MIAKQWAVLKSTIAALDPRPEVAFHPPADEEEILAAEEELGLVFPDEYKQLLRCANGQELDDLTAPHLFPGIRFKPGELGSSSPAWLLDLTETAEMTLACREEFQDLRDDGPFEVIGPASYHDQIIAFTRTDDANSLVIDLKPEPGGTVGQVVMVSTQPFQVAVIAPSLGAFLQLLIDGYSSGRFRRQTRGPFQWWSED